MPEWDDAQATALTPRRFRLLSRHSGLILLVVDGGLLSDSTNMTEVGRQLGLCGSDSQGRQAVQSTRFEFVIKANVLGLTVPSTLLATADEVIEEADYFR